MRWRSLYRTAEKTLCLLELEAVGVAGVGGESRKSHEDVDEDESEDQSKAVIRTEI
jgi:hypothetical protein